MKTLSASENMLKVVFSDDYDFVIPRYQRPYAWTQEHALELFDDLYEHFQATRNLGDAEKLPYFLGSVVLIKNENASLAEVIDGQQRLTTLTILFAAMRDQARDADLRADFQALYQSKAQKLKKIAAKPRLKLRECDQAFFNERVQATDDFSAIQTLISAELKTESQKRIYENSLALLSRVQRLLSTDEELGEFGEFILNRCFLAVVSTPTQESAFRVFSILNNRGLDLLPCDVLKSEIIGRLDVKSQEKYANAWERFERSLGRKTFNELFGHILSIYYPNRTQGKLLELFRNRLLKDVATPEATRRFFDDVLSPCAEYFRDLKRGTLRTVDGSNAVLSPLSTILNALSQVEFSDWVPVALAFLLRVREQQPAASDVERFFGKLERLTSYLYLCSKDAKKRGERFANILKDLQEIDDAWQESLELSPTEQREFLETLDGPVYELPTPNRRRFLLLRLDAFIAETGAVYDVKRATVEHVLPQKSTSEYWRKRWSEEERSTWLHRVGNLVPLSGRKNSKAQNFDFPKKRDAYFLNDNKTTPYALTAQLLGETDWTPAIVEARQKRLLAAFAKHWELDGCDILLEKVVSGVSDDANSQLAAQNFRFEFWSRFSAKLLAATDLKSTQTPSGDRSFEVRLGASGVALSARCRFLQKEFELRLYLTSGKKALYIPTFETNRATLENLAGRPLDFAPTAPGKDQVIVLKTFDFEPSDAANVETVLEQLTKATAAFRQTLRPLVAEQAANTKNISVWTLEQHYPHYATQRELFEYFREELLRRFPDIKQVINKFYVSYRMTKSVVDVEIQKQKLKLAVNLTFDETFDPDNVCFNITDKGHLGSGDVGVYIRDRADVPKALRVVEQSYRKNS